MLDVGRNMLEPFVRLFFIYQLFSVWNAKIRFFFIINTLLASFFLCKMDEHEVVNVDEVESRKKKEKLQENGATRKWRS